jgi:hypothetical protein
MAGDGKYMRILLRKHGKELYLQPSGDFTQDREAARTFESGLVAYAWALEQKLLGVEVLLAFPDQSDDIVTLKVAGSL